MHRIFFIHSSVDGHLGCFHVLAIVNSISMNTGVRVSFSIIVFSEYIPSSGISGSYGSFGLPWWLSGWRNLPAMQETWVQSLGWEGGNGKSLKYSCLKNPMDTGAWPAKVQRVTRVGHNWANQACKNFSKLQGYGERLRSLECCSPWGCKSQTQLSN